MAPKHKDSESNMYAFKEQSASELVTGKKLSKSLQPVSDLKSEGNETTVLDL